MNRRGFFKKIIGLCVAVIPAKLIGSGVEVIETEAFEKNFFECGFTGDQLLNAGYIYAPYIPLYESYYYSAETKCWEKLSN